MSSAEVIRSRAQSKRRGSEEQGTYEDGETRITAPTYGKALLHCSGGCGTFLARPDFHIQGD